jgi:predicted RNase H-like HicB family nuclease
VTTPPKYAVHVERTPDGWWYIEVPEVEGARTQAKRLDQVDEMARDVLAILLDVDPESFGLELAPVAIHEDGVELLNAARSARLAAAEADEAARVAVKRAVVGMSTMGYTMRDIGSLLGVTHQRVAQLMDDTAVTRKGQKRGISTVVGKRIAKPVAAVSSGKHRSAVTGRYVSGSLPTARRATD